MIRFENAISGFSGRIYVLDKISFGLSAETNILYNEIMRIEDIL